MKCCVPGCTSINIVSGGIKFKQFSFFRFPADGAQEKQWRDILRVKPVPGASQKICEKHFSEEFLVATSDNKKSLSWNAIPLPWKETNYWKHRVEKSKRKAPEVASDFYKVLEEYRRAKEKYFSLLGIPKEFEDDFDDSEYFGIHYDGLPWWARPVMKTPSKQEDLESDDEDLTKKLCSICGKLELNYDLHMLLFHPPEMGEDPREIIVEDPVGFEVELLHSNAGDDDDPDYTPADDMKTEDFDEDEDMEAGEVACLIVIDTCSAGPHRDSNGAPQEIFRE